MALKPHFVGLAAGLLSGLASFASATVLTFDIFNDPAKTVYPNDALIIQAYGDNITDFDPVGAVGGKYVRYGSGGGATPNITVEYRYYYIANPTDPSPGQNGPTGGALYQPNYGDLTNVLYDTYNGYLTEVRFTAAPGYQVTLESFDIAAYPSSCPTPPSPAPRSRL